MFRSKQQVWVLFSALLVLSISGAAAQTTTATLAGTVTDETQSVLPGVEITITNLETNATRTAISGDAGQYRVSNLSPGEYELEAQLPGFQTAVRSGIQLSVGRQASLNITLSVGQVSERVVVTGDAPLVDTLSSTIRGLVDEKTLTDLPLNGRSFDQLAMLQAGVVAYYGQGDATGSGITGSGQRMSIGGARPTSNNFMMDGTNINDTSSATPGSVAGVNLGLEAIREFEVLTSTYDATFGRNSGGVINIVTKSGTNELHGSLFWYHRNDNLDATNFFVNKFGQDKPEFKRNQYGFSLGGPVVKDKIFLFGTYEGFRERLGVPLVSTVPTADGRLGIGVGRLPGPDGESGTDDDIIVDLPVNPGVVPYLSLYPLPNGELNSDQVGLDGTGQFLLARSRPINEDYLVIRYDHQLSDSDSFFVRYTYDDGDRSDPDPVALFDGFTESRRQYVTAEWKHIFSPTILNTARLGFNRSRRAADDELNHPELELIPGEERWFFNMSAQVTGGSASLASLGAGGFSTFAWNSFEYADDLHFSKGRHSLRVGANINRIQHNFTNATFAGGRYSFNDFPSVLQGISRVFEGYLPGSNIFRGMRSTLIGLYIQDDFTVRPNLTLNLGFRYETMTEPSEVNNLQSQLTNPLDDDVKVGAPYFEQPGHIFAPRIGIAWDIRGDGKTSLRMGAGIFSDTLAGNFWVNNAINAKPFNVVGSVSDPNPAVFPNAFVLIGSSGSDSIIRDASDAKFPTRTQWNLTLQQELFPDTVLTVAYTGAVGRHGIRTAEANTAFPTGTVDGNPVWCVDPQNSCAGGVPVRLDRRNGNFGFLLTHNTDANSSYNSMQVSLRRRLSQGLQFLGSYTWGHSIDEGSQQWGSEGRNNPQNTTDLYDHSFDKGNSIFDVQHAFVLNGVYALPFGNNLDGAARHIVAGWEVNSILTLTTGNPVTIVTGFNRAQNRDTRNPDRPDLAGSDNNPVVGDGRDPDRYFDTGAFALPAEGTHGNLARSSLRGPGVAVWDFGFFKNFNIGEQVGAQFRAEFFNVLNRANFAAPAASIFTSSGSVRGNAAKITRTVTTGRQIQFALRFTF